MPRVSSVAGLSELLDRQVSVASRAQLLALGLSDQAMQYRIRPGGRWQALLPGVYLSVTGVPTQQQKEMAALLYAGPHGLVTGPAALLHYGIRSPADLDIIDVLVPLGRQRRDASFVRLQRTARMPAEAASDGPVRLVPAARAVADTARRLTSPAHVRAVVTEAVRSGLCTVGELATEHSEGPIRGSAVLRSVLAELAEETTTA